MNGFEDYYSVSNLGRVRSEPRTYTRSDGVKHSTPARILSPGRDKRGYNRFNMRVNKKTHMVSVHRLVAETFLGPAPEGKPWVLHADDNPSNNKVDNLSWGSPSENAMQKVARGRQNNYNWKDGLCIRGHSIATKERVYTTPKGMRQCRACRWLKRPHNRGKTLEDFERTMNNG